MKEIKTFMVQRGWAGGTKQLDKKVAELQAEGWTIRDIKQPTTLNPNFYIEAERGDDTEKPIEESGVGISLGTLTHNVVSLRDEIGELTTKLDEIIGLLKEIRNSQ